MQQYVEIRYVRQYYPVGKKTIITALYTHTYGYISINNERVKDQEMLCLLLEARKSHTGHL